MCMCMCVRERQTVRQTEGEKQRDRTVTKPRKNVKEMKKRFCNVQVLRNN